MKTFGVVASDQIAGSAPRARLQVGEIGLHTRNLAIEVAALWRGIPAEHQKLVILAAERARIGARARKFGALTLTRALRAARAAASSDSLLQPGAFAGVLRQRNVAGESDDRSRERGQGAD